MVETDGTGKAWAARLGDELRIPAYQEKTCYEKLAKSGLSPPFQDFPFLSHSIDVTKTSAAAELNTGPSVSPIRYFSPHRPSQIFFRRVQPLWSRRSIYRHLSVDGTNANFPFHVSEGASRRCIVR